MPEGAGGDDLGWRNAQPGQLDCGQIGRLAPGGLRLAQGLRQGQHERSGMGGQLGRKLKRQAAPDSVQRLGQARIASRMHGQKQRHHLAHGFGQLGAEPAGPGRIHLARPGEDLLQLGHQEQAPLIRREQVLEGRIAGAQTLRRGEERLAPACERLRKVAHARLLRP